MELDKEAMTITVVKELTLDHPPKMLKVVIDTGGDEEGNPATLVPA